MRIAIIPLASLALIALLAACGGDDGESKPVDASETPKPPPERLAAPTMEGGDAPAGASQIGERVEVEGYSDIVVEAFTRSMDAPSAPGEGHFEAEPGREFLVLTLRVINDTDLPADINPFNNLAILSRGENINAALTFFPVVEGGLEAAVLPPGEEAVGLVAWSAPPGFDDLSLQYVPFSEAGTLEGLPATIDLE